MHRRHSAFALVSSLLLGQGSAAAAAEGQRAATAYVHKATGFTFPASVGDFALVATREYNADATDVSAGYDLVRPDKRIAVTVYVYPAPGVAAEARDQACSQAFNGIKAEIEAAHDGARLVEQSSIASPSPSHAEPGRRAVYEFTDTFSGDRQRLRSEADLYCYVGGPWLVAYRTTAPIGVDYSAELGSLMRELRWPAR